MRRVINIKAPKNGGNVAVVIRAEVNTTDLAQYEAERTVEKLRDSLAESLRDLPYASWYPHELKHS